MSLTTTSCKILEHVIAKHITSVEETNLLGSDHHGSRLGHATVIELIEGTHDKFMHAVSVFESCQDLSSCFSSKATIIKC